MLTTSWGKPERLGVIVQWSSSTNIKEYKCTLKVYIESAQANHYVARV